MSKHLRYQIWIALAAGIIFFTYLGATSLWDDDETLYASCAREMLHRNDWVVPMYNGQMFPDKPPLMFWLMMVGFKLFGVNEFGARFFSAFLGVGTALLTYHLGRLLFNPRVGLWAGLITASSIIFTVSARAATVDSALVFVSTLALLCFVAALRGQRSEVGGQDSEPERVLQFSICNLHFAICNKTIIQYLLFLLFYISLGIAILAKGPVGFLLPMASLGLFLMIVNSRREMHESKAASAMTGWKRTCLSMIRTFHPRYFLKSLWQLRPITGVIVLLAVALPWFILVGLRTDGTWLQQFFGEHNLQRTLHSREGHSGPIFYYLIAILIGFFPWSVFLGPSLIDLVRRMRQQLTWRAGDVLLACWIGVIVIFWSLVSTKLPHYVLPAYPALALLVGVFIHGWLSAPEKVNRWWGRNAMLTLIVVGTALLIALPIISAFYLPGEGIVGLVGLVLVLGGAWGLVYIERQQVFRAMMVFTVTSIIFLLAMFGFAALRIDRHQNATQLIAEIHKISPGSHELFTYRFQRASFVYYAGQTVPHCRDAATLSTRLSQAKQPFIITSYEFENEIERHFPGAFAVIARRPKFLKNGDIIVLARRSAQGAPGTATTQPSDTRKGL